MTLVAGGVETNNRADVAAAANEALWKPTLIALVTHGVRSGDPAHEEPRLQPERDGRVRCGAWSGGVVTSSLIPDLRISALR